LPLGRPIEITLLGGGIQLSGRSVAACENGGRQMVRHLGPADVRFREDLGCAVIGSGTAIDRDVPVDGGSHQRMPEARGLSSRNTCPDEQVCGAGRVRGRESG
jgi:hypothetical protein